MSQRDYTKAYNDKVRTTTLEVLGGCCVRCGLTELVPGFLDVDHINGRDERDFTAGGSKLRTSVVVWRAVRDGDEENLARFQLLCPNCHKLKSLEECDVRNNRRG